RRRHTRWPRDWSSDVCSSDLYYCLDRDLNTPGNWRAILYLKLKNLKTGSITDERVHPDDKVDVVYLETKDYQYSYKDGDDYVFRSEERRVGKERRVRQVMNRK